MTEQYWEPNVKCANCGEKQACAVAQVAPQPGGDIPIGWMLLVFKERMPAIATTPQEALRETARAQSLTLPVCSEACAVELLVKRAYTLARTKNVKADLQERFRKIVEEG